MLFYDIYSLTIKISLGYCIHSRQRDAHGPSRPLNHPHRHQPGPAMSLPTGRGRLGPITLRHHSSTNRRRARVRRPRNTSAQTVANWSPQSVGTKPLAPLVPIAIPNCLDARIVSSVGHILSDAEDDIKISVLTILQ